MKKNAMRVAIVHNGFWHMTGAEQVFAAIANEFNDADVFLLNGNEKLIDEVFQGRNVEKSFLAKYSKSKQSHQQLAIFWKYAIESFDFSQYDLVISSCSNVAKGILTRPETKHISVIYSPNRYLWDDYGKFNGFLMRKLLNVEREWEKAAVWRPDKIITISHFVNKRLIEFLGRGADEIIYPGIKLENFIKYRTEKASKPYFIAISPFQHNKRLDLLLKLAVQKQFNLVITGEFNLSFIKKSLKKIRASYKIASKADSLEISFQNGSQITFTGWLSDEFKKQLIYLAKATLMIGREDFGIAAVESIALGTPVIALKNSGTAEIINQDNGVIVSASNYEGVIEEFSQAMLEIESREFIREKMISSVSHFSHEKFIKNLVESIMSD